MADNATVADIATLKNEILHLKDELTQSESACRVELGKALQRIDALEKYKAKADKYGWMAVGAVCAGIVVVSMVQGAKDKIGKVLLWLFS